MTLTMTPFSLVSASLVSHLSSLSFHFSFENSEVHIHSTQCSPFLRGLCISRLSPTPEELRPLKTRTLTTECIHSLSRGGLKRSVQTYLTLKSYTAFFRPRFSFSSWSSRCFSCLFSLSTRSKLLL